MLCSSFQTHKKTIDDCSKTVDEYTNNYYITIHFFDIDYIDYAVVILKKMVFYTFIFTSNINTGLNNL